MACVGTRYLVCFATWFSLLVFYIIRSNMGVAILQMVAPSNSDILTDELNHKFIWSHSLRGQILGGFFYGYASLHFVGALISTKLGPRILLTLCLFGAGLFSLLTPYLTYISPYALIAARIIVGLFSSSLYPIIQGILGVWTPASERTLLASLTHSGNIFGIVLNYAIGGMLCNDNFSTKGWEYFFYVSGVMSFIAMILWLCFGFDSPSTHPYITKKERDYISGSNDDDHDIDSHCSKMPSFNSIPFSDIFTSKAVWACTAGHTGTLFIFYALVVGHAKFLHEVFNVNAKKASFYSAIPFVANFVGQLIIPSIVDTLRNKHNINITKIRKGVSGIAFLVGSSLIMTVGFFNTDQMIYVIIVMTIALSFIGFNNSGYLTASIDISPKYAGIVMGIMNTFGSIAGFVNATMAGVFLQKYEHNKLLGWRYTFIVTGFVAFSFGMIFVIFGSSELQPWSSGKIYKPLRNDFDEELVNTSKVLLNENSDDNNVKVSRV